MGGLFSRFWRKKNTDQYNVIQKDLELLQQDIDEQQKSLSSISVRHRTIIRYILFSMLLTLIAYAAFYWLFGIHDFKRFPLDSTLYVLPFVGQPFL